MPYTTIRTGDLSYILGTDIKKNRSDDFSISYFYFAKAWNDEKSICKIHLKTIIFNGQAVIQVIILLFADVISDVFRRRIFLIKPNICHVQGRYRNFVQVYVAR